jgi:glutamate--cysteine ligase
VGVRNPGGDYNQLATTLLQIENEFYGTIRPKRTIQPGERPLHALRERGVEYVEVRLMDLDPFEPVGIRASTLRFLDVFLLHCLLADSPPDSPAEIRELGLNQHLTAARGREPGLSLMRAGQPVLLQDWGQELLAEMLPLAQHLDALHGGSDHADAVRQAQIDLADPTRLPSARVLAAVRQHQDSFVGFVRECAEQTHAHLLALPWSAAQQQAFEAEVDHSVAAQHGIEAADSLPFEQYRLQYIAADRLLPRHKKAVNA